MLQSGPSSHRPCQVLAQTHGDSECLAAQGGTDCLLQDAGPRFGHILDAPLWVNAEVNEEDLFLLSSSSSNILLAERACFS